MHLYVCGNLLYFHVPHCMYVTHVYVYVAICQSECVHGECTAPNKCTCDLGWKGFTCNKGTSAEFLLNLIVWNQFKFDCLEPICLEPI